MTLSPAPSPSGFRTIHQQVVHVLGRAIVRGDYAVGTPLPQEPVLCAQLGVSRGALREAVKALVAKGLLEIAPRTGTRPLPQSAWNLLDADVLGWYGEADRGALVAHLTELREIVEPGSARLAARRAAAADAEEISRLARAMAAAESPDDFIAADVAFHAAVLRAGRNPMLASLVEPLHLALRASFEVTSRAEDAASESIPLHRAVAEAIVAGDEEEAAAAMAAIVATSGAHFRRVTEAAR